MPQSPKKTIWEHRAAVESSLERIAKAGENSPSDLSDDVLRGVIDDALSGHIRNRDRRTSARAAIIKAIRAAQRGGNKP